MFEKAVCQGWYFVSLRPLHMINVGNFPEEASACGTIGMLFVCLSQILLFVEQGECFWYEKLMCQNNGYGYQDSYPILFVFCLFFSVYCGIVIQDE